jgi:AcrR family transcriptional regulator
VGEIETSAARQGRVTGRERRAARAPRAKAGRRATQSDIPELQRIRLLTATAACCRQVGAGRVTVTDVLRHAKISRRTFYELFADRDELIAAAFDEALRRAAAQVVPAYKGQQDWRGAVREGMHGLLFFLDFDRTMANLLVIDSLGAGDQVLLRRAAAVEALVGAVDRGRELARAPKGLGRLTAEGVVGGVLAILHARMLAHPATPVSPLAGELTALVVAPYLGAAAMAREAGRRPPRHGAVSVGGEETSLAALGLRLTHRTVRVLRAIAELGSAAGVAAPARGLSNRQIADAAGIVDQGQASKLLQRLAGQGVIVNVSPAGDSERANAWQLTAVGERIERATRV